jgi:hypothetical protein
VSPLASPASHSETDAFPRAMFTMVRISSTITAPSQLQSPTQEHGAALGVAVGVTNRSRLRVAVGLAAGDCEAGGVAVAVGSEAVLVIDAVGVPSGGREPVTVGGGVSVTVGVPRCGVAVEVAVAGCEAEAVGDGVTVVLTVGDRDPVAVSVGAAVTVGVCVGRVTHVLLAVHENGSPLTLPLARMVSVPTPPVPL